MPWYTAVLVVEGAIAGQTAAHSIIDKQIRIIQAASADEAYEKAHALGAIESLSYANGEGQEVSWKFLGLYDLARLDYEQLHDGMEVYSLLERGEAASRVTEKQQMTVFWANAHNHPAAADARFEEKVRPYTPQ